MPDKARLTNPSDQLRSFFSLAPREKENEMGRSRARHFGSHSGNHFGSPERIRLALTTPEQREEQRRLKDRWDTLPDEVQWKVLMSAGCKEAANVALSEGLSKEKRLGLYDMYLTDYVAPGSMTERAECASAPYDPKFTASCSRFYENCKRVELVKALDDSSIRSVLSEYRDEITAGTFRPAIGEWDVSRVTDMSLLFDGWSDFNQPLDKWNTASVVDMYCMFMGASSFNQKLTFNTARVVDMSGMFAGASSFNQVVRFDTSSARYVASMFRGATSQNSVIELTDLCNCQDLTGLLSDTTTARVNTRRVRVEAIQMISNEDWVEWGSRLTVSSRAREGLGCYAPLDRLAFGTEPDPTDDRRRGQLWSNLPKDIKWKTLMEAGCESAAEVAAGRGVPKEDRLELYTMYHGANVL